MNLFVEKRRVVLPNRHCTAEDVEWEVRRINPPFVVKPQGGREFSVRRKVFLNADGLRVECENDNELRFACKLSAENHNQNHTSDDTQRVIDETDEMERAALEQPCSDEGGDETDEPREEEDISIQEWSQLGYKWFRKEDVLYI